MERDITPEDASWVKAPSCPDCKSPMVFIAVDMTGQGGPPCYTWLCKEPKCGRALPGTGKITIFD
jgi:hypothetical protein